MNGVEDTDGNTVYRGDGWVLTLCTDGATDLAVRKMGAEELHRVMVRDA